jgi:hypothetical protein
MTLVNKFITCLVFTAFAAGASAADGGRVLITNGAQKGAAAFSVDVVSDGRAVAVGVIVKIPGLEKAKVDLSSCVAALPKTHQGSCAVKGDELRIGFFSMTNATLPAGVAPVGTVKVFGSVGTPVVTMTEISDANAEVISSASELTK